MDVFVYSNENNSIKVELDAKYLIGEGLPVEKQEKFFVEASDTYENVVATLISSLGKLVLFNDETYLWTPYTTEEELTGFYINK